MQFPARRKNSIAGTTTTWTKFSAFRIWDLSPPAAMSSKEPLEGRGKYLAIYEIETEDIEQTMRMRAARKAEEVRQGKDPGYWVAVWGTTLFREIFRYPPK